MHRVPSAIKHLLQIALLTICLFSCSPTAQPTTPTAVESVLVGPENIIYIRREAISTGPRLSGSLDPQEQARVRSETSGSVTSVEADLGKVVKKGQILARIEDTALRNALVSARAALRSAELELQNATRQAERTEALVKGGALATRDLEIAQSNRSTAGARLAQTKAQLAAAQDQWEATTIKSPINGIVSERGVNQGDVVSVGLPLFTVIDPSSMRLQASVPSYALSFLKIGAPVTFQVRGYPDRTFTGKIEQIAPAADPATRQITTLVSIPNPGGELIAGLFAEGRIGAETRETLVAPMTAINSADENPSVLRIKDGVTESISVKLGLMDRETERAEILGPVQEGDILLTGATKTIPAGTPVTLTGKNPNASR